MFRTRQVRHHQFRLGWALLLVGLLGLAGCGPHETAVQQGNREQILHRGIGAAVPTLDPHLAQGLAEIHVLGALFEGLVAADPQTLEPVPGVASRWDISRDGLTYTFHLRSDARWSNGDPVTANDFAQAFLRVLAPALGSPNAPLLYILDGAEALHRGIAVAGSASGIEVLDPLTLRLSLAHPAPYFLSMLTHPAWMPVHQASIAKVGNPLDRATAWAQPGKLVSNGPFSLEAWETGQFIRCTANPMYWDRKNVFLRGIVFHPIDSVDAEERAFRAGQLHLTDAVPLAKLAAYQKMSNSPLRVDPALGTYFYRINTARPFLRDARVRRALTQSIDRGTIVKNLLEGVPTVATSLVPPGLAGYEPIAGLTFDPDAARAALAEAGYPGGKGAPPVELLFNTSENHRLIAEAIQAMWQRELGLEIVLLNMEFNTTLDARKTGNYQVLRSSWFADYPAPEAFLQVWTGDSGYNYTGWTDRSYDQLLQTAARATDKAQRVTLLRQAEAVVVEAAPFIPIYHYAHAYLVDPAVQGWYTTPMDRHPYKGVKLTPAP